MSIQEGRNASWVGDDPELEIGERCRVLSVERTYSHVKWLTGKKTGSYEMVLNDSLVGDLPPARDFDAFTFEARSGRIVNTACKDVLARRGEQGLWAALVNEGHFEELGDTARAQVIQLVSQLRSDPSWIEVQADLGDGTDFERHALRQLLLAALDEVDAHEAAQAPGA